MFGRPARLRLREGLARFSHVELVAGCALSRFDDCGDVVVCTLDLEGTRREVRTRYLVGSDGANSAVREALGVAAGDRVTVTPLP